MANKYTDEYRREAVDYVLNFDGEKTIKEILTIVYDSLDERGYNAIDQMVGYILSGDPSYITSHNNARNVIGRIERDDLVEELIKAYLDK